MNVIDDGCNSFARGHYTVGKQLIEQAHNRVRQLVECCDNCQGFIFTHAVAGGTGSGLSTLLLERLSTTIVEPYNALLATHWLIDHLEVSVVFDNEAIYNICQEKLDMRKIDYEHINKLVAKVISSTTASLRFNGELNIDLQQWQVDLCPFPRLHFMTCSYAPMVSPTLASTHPMLTEDITPQAVDPQYFFTKFYDFDELEDKYMAISLNYRGDVKYTDTLAAVRRLRVENKVVLVDWVPTGFKVGLNTVPPNTVDGDPLEKAPRTATMIGNQTAVSRVFSQRICAKFDLLFSQRAFCHWYSNEGMEITEFSEAKQDLSFLEKDYLDVLTEVTDSDEDEDSDFG